MKQNSLGTAGFVFCTSMESGNLGINPSLQQAGCADKPKIKIQHPKHLKSSPHWEELGTHGRAE